jgi:transcription antitermination factor NusB
MRKTTAGRILAVQALYQYDIRGKAFLKEFEDFVKQSGAGPEVAAMGEELFFNCLDRLEETDAAIAQAAQHWKLSRLAAVDRAVLRLGAYELLFKSDLPPKVAIDEAVRLAKRFSTADSGAFVNGVLDHIMNAPRGQPAADNGAGA